MRLIKILLSVIVVLVLTVVGLVFILPGEKIANLAADQVKAQTGRELVFDGDVNFSVFPTLGVSTGSVALSNADWSDKGPMFEAQGAKIGVDLLSLITGNIQVKNIELISPNILLEQDGQGHANWDLFPSSDEVEAAQSDDGGEAGTGFTLDKLTVSDASVRYLDGTGEEIAIRDLNAALAWGDGEATLDITAKPADEDVAIDATVGDLDALLGGEITSVDATIKAVGNSLSFAGRASIAPEIQGTASADMPAPDAFMAALGLAAAGIPATEFSGDITLTKEQLFSLRNGKLKVAGNAFDADADVDLAAKPVVTANIQAGALNLETLMAAGGGDGSGAAESAGWSKAPIDASALALFDGTISLSAQSISTGTLNFGTSRMTVAVDNSRAVATLQQLNGYDGTISGQFVTNNRSGLSVGGNINVASMELMGLLDDFAEIDRFTGKADAQISFLAAGNSLHAIMNSLQGDGKLTVGRGTIAGMDLDQLFRGTPSGGTTVFDNMGASWTIANGILTNSDLLMDLPNVQAKGAGTIGLGPQNIDYTLTPQLKNDTDSGLSVPVRIKGPWSAPKIWPDLEAIVKQNFKEETKQLEEKAKAAVADKLGVTQEDGKSLEDVAKEKLEKEVGNKLLKLLGGD